MEQVIQQNMHNLRFLDGPFPYLPGNVSQQTVDSIQQWKTHNHRFYLRGLIPYSNARYSEVDGTLRGAAFILAPDAPAATFMRNRDLCSGVSAYRVVSFPAETRGDVASFTARAIASFRKKAPFVDTSIYDNDREVGVTLGAHNCSVTFVKGIVDEDLNEAWFLIVRNYHENSVGILRTLVREEGLTVAQVYASDVYQQTLMHNDAARNAVAASIATSLGLELSGGLSTTTLDGQKVHVAKPEVVNRFNILGRLPNYEGESAFVYYSGAYGFAEHKPNAIVFGLGPSKGYVLIGHGNGRGYEVGTVKTAFGFPMGVPKLVSSVADALTRKSSDIIQWGSKFAGHTRASPDLYHDDYIKSEVGRAHIRELGFRKDVNMLRLVPKGVYMSSPSELDLTIDQLLDLQPTATTIMVPSTHPFVQTALMPGYQALKATDRSVKLIGGVIKQETDRYVELSTDTVRQILSIVRS
jgi:hypothetical protein